MNDETKLVLAFLVLLGIGFALIAIGSGIFTKLAATFCGLAVTWSATLILTAMIRRR